MQGVCGHFGHLFVFTLTLIQTQFPAHVTQSGLAGLARCQETLTGVLWVEAGHGPVAAAEYLALEEGNGADLSSDFVWHWHATTCKVQRAAEAGA